VGADTFLGIGKSLTNLFDFVFPCLILFKDHPRSRGEHPSPFNLASSFETLTLPSDSTGILLLVVLANLTDFLSNFGFSSWSS
jgi:hypothetical protein